MFCFSQVSSISLLASTAPSRGATIQPTRVAAEHIEDHVEIEISPLGGTAQLGDVPAPQLIGRGGEQFRFPVRRMSELIAALARGAVLSQDPIHGSCRAQILAFIEQGGLNGGRRRILKARGMEQLANGVAFLRAQGAGGRWLRARRRSHRGGRRPEQRPPSIEGGAG